MPQVQLMGTAELGGELVLDFTRYSFAGLTMPVEFTFASASGFTGAFTSVRIEGIDPILVETDGQSGTFVLVPSPLVGIAVIAMGLMASRRRS